MQYVEGFSGEQAADAMRGHIDWKYALSLELADRGLTPRSWVSFVHGCLLTVRKRSSLI